MNMYDVEANGLGDLAEDSDEDSGSGQKRTSFEDSNGVRRSETVNGESSYGAPRRTRTTESERVSTAGHKSFER
jgi:hypothetical protein